MLASTVSFLGPVELSAEDAPQASAKRNVLFLISDDLRPELGCYGNTIIQSPNIDRLASRGVVFNRAYCQQAVCSPSRTSVLTGSRPDTTKVWDLRTHFRTTIPDVITLPQHFKQSGYVSRGLGKIYHGDATTHRGLDDLQSWSDSGQGQIPPELEEGAHKDRRKNKAAKTTQVPASFASVELTRTDRGNAFRVSDDPPNGGGEGQLANETISALRELKAGSQPFFLAVGFHKPHLPFVAPMAYWDLYNPEEIPLAPNIFLPRGAPAYALADKNEMWKYSGVPNVSHIPDDFARQLKHGYYASVSYMDAQVGRILDELDRLELSNNTIVVLWGDHGWKLGEHDRWCKHSNVELDARAPLIISTPDMKQAGATTNAIVEFVDIYPTVAELAGLSLPDHLEGKSLRPLLDQPSRDWPSVAISQYPRTVKGHRLMGYSMRTDRYRFTCWVDRKDHKQIEAIELYDHQTDPQENINIAGAPDNEGVVAKLTTQLMSHPAVNPVPATGIDQPAK